MKKILLISGIAILGFTATFAQNQKTQHTKNRELKMEKRNPEEIATKQTERLDKIVTLSDEQKVKAKAAYLKHAADRVSSRTENIGEINEILTPEQAELLKQNKADKMKMMRVEDKNPVRKSMEISK